MRFSFIAIAAALILSGCNTYYQQGYQKIVVRTPGIEDANCKLTTPTNRYDVMTPRPVTVERSHDPLTVECEKTGYYPASAVIKSKVYANAAALNVFNGIVPGMAYDVASNSIYTYPDTIIIALLPMPAEEQAPEPAPYELQKKPEPVKPVPLASAPSGTAADKSLSKSGKK